ncbi:MAG TPA: NADP-dependent oxidoreductase [Solirubrobacterales bacterium]|nr:NADP-dependent oxidoreductase [Solirubrobacterales bacterium]
MKAFLLEDFDSEPRLRDDLPDPQPGEGQIAVRVHHTSVNPIDNVVAGGMLRDFADYRFPVILGRDFAGVVERVGAGVDSFEPGDEVFGFVPATDPDVHEGAWTELALLPAGQAALKPAGVDFASAGAAAVAGLTGIAAVNALELQEGESLLIVGAAGGVGSFAVQIARRAGAHIIAPGLPEDEGFLVDLGVDHVIARDGDVVAQTRELEDGGVAALIDTVSGSPEELEVYAAALADGGRVASPVRAAGEGPGRHNVSGSAEDGALDQLAQLLADGTLRVPIQRTYELDEAGAALADLPAKHTQGKLAIAVAP